MTSRRGRTAAEWATFAGSCAVLAVAVIVIGAQSLGTQEIASPVATIESTREVAGKYFVDVSVRNGGQTTAANVQVTAELVVDDQPSMPDQTIDFLAGAEEQTLTFVFTDDPSEGELTVSVSSFAEP